MKTKICLNTWKRLTKLTAICALVLISSAFAGSMVVVQKLKHGSAAGTGQPNACSQTSQHALDSCRAGPQSEYTLTLASCDNIPNSAARQQCRDQTLTTLHEAQQTCQAQFAAGSNSAACSAANRTIRLFTQLTSAIRSTMPFSLWSPVER